MRSYWLNMLWVLCLYVTSPVQAEELAHQILGVTLPDRVVVGSEATPLILNGFAKRQLWGVEAYIGALYLQDKKQNVNYILISDDPVLMKFYFLSDDIKATQLREMFRSGILINNPDLNRYPHELKRFHEFLALFTKDIHAGDSISFQYMPENQTLTVLSNRKELHQWTRGKLFFNMILKMWIGQHPPSRDFKAEILDQEN